MSKVEIKQENEKKTKFFFERFKVTEDFLKEKRLIQNIPYDEGGDDDCFIFIIVEYQKEWYLGYYIGDNQYMYYIIPEELRGEEWKIRSVCYEVFEVGFYFTIGGKYFIKKQWGRKRYTSGFYLIEVDKEPEPYQVASREELRYLWEIKNGIVNL